jgi:hypothetical protein
MAGFYSNGDRCLLQGCWTDANSLLALPAMTQAAAAALEQAGFVCLPQLMEELAQRPQATARRLEDLLGPQVRNADDQKSLCCYTGGQGCKSLQLCSTGVLVSSRLQCCRAHLGSRAPALVTHVLCETSMGVCCKHDSR